MGRKRRNHTIRYLIQIVCMVAILVVIIMNQEQIKSWMQQMRQSDKERSQEQLLTEEKKDSVMLPTTVVQDETRYQQDEFVVKREKDANQNNYMKAQELDRSLKRQNLKAMDIHGAYYSALRVSSREKVERIIESFKGTNINAIVIDVKDDHGKITFPIENELASSIGAITNQIWDAREMVEMFHNNGIYVIGRVVAFRDYVLPKKQPEYALTTKEGKVFVDRAGDTWLNPYNKQCWNYLVDISSEALAVGFDEIQFDYVRFSTEAKADKVSFGVDSEAYTKTQVITDFVEYAVQKLHEKDGLVSADVFGAIISSEVDARTVGQDYVELSRYLDFICPMIYPSHYADGCYGLTVPDLQPYQLILGALNDSAEELLIIDQEEHCAKVRPWLQDFTASWKKTYQKYGLAQVEEQIQGVNDAGYDQWLLWNSSGRYSEINQ